MLAVAVLPLLGIGCMKLYQSEMPGPFKEERLTPRLADTARTLWVTYFALGVACTLAYWLAGMSFFDALCHGLSTVSLGGSPPAARALGFMTATRLSWSPGRFHCSPRSTSPSGTSPLSDAP